MCEEFLFLGNNFIRLFRGTYRHHLYGKPNKEPATVGSEKSDV
jgi:hypothetical protein